MQRQNGDLLRRRRRARTPIRTPTRERRTPPIQTSGIKRVYYDNEDDFMKDRKLLEACKTGDRTNITKILADKPNINCVDNNGNTPLFLTVEGGTDNHLFICALLLSRREIDVDKKCEEGFTALHLACFDIKEKFVKVLLAKNADPNVKENNGDVPLDYTYPSVSYSISSWNNFTMLVGKTDLSLQDNDGDNALHNHICLSPNYTDNNTSFREATNLLVSCATLKHFRQTNKKGKTPLQLAMDYSDTLFIDAAYEKLDGRWRELNDEELEFVGRVKGTKFAKRWCPEGGCTISLHKEFADLRL